MGDRLFRFFVAMMTTARALIATFL